jgi:hypothetical protein
VPTLHRQLGDVVDVGEADCDRIFNAMPIRVPCPVPSCNGTVDTEPKSTAYDAVCNRRHVVTVLPDGTLRPALNDR